MCGSLDVTKFILDGKLLKKSISSAVLFGSTPNVSDYLHPATSGPAETR